MEDYSDQYPILDEEHPDYEFLKANLDTITGVEVDAYNTWHDDHALCFGMTLKFPDRNVKVGAWWEMEETFADAIRAERSKTHLAELVARIKAELN